MLNGCSTLQDGLDRATANLPPDDGGLPPAHLSGLMPILDVQVRMREDKAVDWRHFRKLIALSYTILTDSAMPEDVKRLTLVQEGIQMLRNTQPSLHPEMRVGLLEDLAERMQKSGYPEDYRRGGTGRVQVSGSCCNKPRWW